MDIHLVFLLVDRVDDLLDVGGHVAPVADGAHVVDLVWRCSVAEVVAQTDVG